MKKILAGNWKMNPINSEEAEELFSSVKKSPQSPDVEVVIIPPAIYIPLFRDRGLRLGVQNLFHEAEGSYTGEISAPMAKNLGCKYAIVGHSERREYFNEDNELINKKIKACFQAGLVPILCVGEKKEERHEGKTSQVIKKQLKEAFRNIELEGENFVVAYEPIWAIGSGEACKPETAFKMRLLIKKTLTEIFSREAVEDQSILYGGSADLGNCESYTQQADFDGLLVGGASLRAKEFSKMIQQI